MRTRTLGAIALTIGLGGTTIATGQGPQAPMAPPSSKAVVLKNKAPVSDELLRVKLPRPQEAKLANGLQLLVLEDRRVPRITAQLIIPGAGGYYDPANLPGVASVTSAMMREGTATRTSAQLSEQLETIAATLNVGTGMSSTEANVFGSCLTEHADRLFEIFGDVLLNPSFPDEELARYKQRTRAGLLQQRSIAGFLGAEMFARVMYGTHPAGRISLTADNLDKVTRQAMVDFHQARYVPDHAALAIAGDISLAEARKLVEARLGSWKKRGTPAPSTADPPAPGTAKVSFVARPNSVQTNLLVGSPAISRLDPDYDVLQVMNKVIGGGPTGRLFIILREEKGYTYGAYSNLAAGQWRGAWQASSEVRSEVTEAALRDLLAEVARLRDQPVADKEFRDQKRAMVGSFALSLENPQQMIGYYVTSWRFKLPADYWDKYPERIAAVTQAQVQAAAKKYLDPARLQIIAVGEPAKVAEVLKGFGPVETYDTEGKRVTAGSTN
ncbi:MAG: M16 family metallopeptidase [Vicinamibacterales bacterium]